MESGKVSTSILVRSLLAKRSLSAAWSEKAEVGGNVMREELYIKALYDSLHVEMDRHRGTCYRRV